MPHVIHTVPVLPAPQLAPLTDAYAAAIAAKRRQMILGIAITLFLLALSGLGAEVDPAMFWNKIGNFTDYFGRLAHLDSGEYVWTDPVEWFWGLRRFYYADVSAILVLIVLCVMMIDIGTEKLRHGLVRMEGAR